MEFAAIRGGRHGDDRQHTAVSVAYDAVRVGGEIIAALAVEDAAYVPVAHPAGGGAWVFGGGQRVGERAGDVLPRFAGVLLDVVEQGAQGVRLEVFVEGGGERAQAVAGVVGGWCVGPGGAELVTGHGGNHAAVTDTRSAEN